VTSDLGAIVPLLGSKLTMKRLGSLTSSQTNLAGKLPKFFRTRD
jgi:hypothetical protein